MGYSYVRRNGRMPELEQGVNRDNFPHPLFSVSGFHPMLRYGSSAGEPSGGNVGVGRGTFQQARPVSAQRLPRVREDGKLGGVSLLTPDDFLFVVSLPCSSSSRARVLPSIDDINPLLVERSAEHVEETLVDGHVFGNLLEERLKVSFANSEPPED